MTSYPGQMEKYPPLDWLVLASKDSRRKIEAALIVAGQRVIPRPAYPDSISLEWLADRPDVGGFVVDANTRKELYFVAGYLDGCGVPGVYVGKRDGCDGELNRILGAFAVYRVEDTAALVRFIKDGGVYLPRAETVQTFPGPTPPVPVSER